MAQRKEATGQISLFDDFQEEFLAPYKNALSLDELPLMTPQQFYVLGDVDGKETIIGIEDHCYSDGIFNYFYDDEENVYEVYDKYTGLHIDTISASDDFPQQRLDILERVANNSDDVNLRYQIHYREVFANLCTAEQEKIIVAEKAQKELAKAEKIEEEEEAQASFINEQAFYEILVDVSNQHNLELTNDKCRDLAKVVNGLVNKTKTENDSDWINHRNIANDFIFDLKVSLIKDNFPARYTPHIAKQVYEYLEEDSKIFLSPEAIITDEEIQEEKAEKNALTKSTKSQESDTEKEKISENDIVEELWEEYQDLVFNELYEEWQNEQKQTEEVEQETQEEKKTIEETPRQVEISETKQEEKAEETETPEVGDNTHLNSQENLVSSNESQRQPEQNKQSEQEDENKHIYFVSPSFVETKEPTNEVNLETEVKAQEETQNDTRLNFVIENDNLGVGTKKEKYAKNIKAIKLLKQLEAEERNATAEEQKVLSDYVGWGGLSDAFDEKKWANEYKELKELLTDDEYNEAQGSTLTSFYTPPLVIRSIYKKLMAAGYQGGNVLEPCCGVGNFFGMMPKEIQEKSNLFGVELDSISGRIAKQLYQKANIEVTGFENSSIDDNFADIAVGNVPFGDYKVYDNKYNKQNFRIHDYFFAKTLDKVRSGGVVAFITSNGTLDKANSKVREYLSSRAEFLGAVRLPNNTFKANAGTEPTTDIIFLKKRDVLDFEASKTEDWIGTSIKWLDDEDEPLQLNRYFLDHPEMVLGDMKFVNSQYGKKPACIAREGEDLEEALNNALSNLDFKIEKAETANLEIDENAETIPATLGVKNYAHTIVNGKLYFREGAVMRQIGVSNDKDLEQIKAVLEIRDTAKTLVSYECNDSVPEEVLIEQRNKLNEVYDNYVAKYGRLYQLKTKQGTDRVIADFRKRELDIPFLYALEDVKYQDKKIVGADKSAIFTKRITNSTKVITSVDSAQEAIVVSLNQLGKLDIDYMAQLYGKSKEETLDELLKNGDIFFEPEQSRIKEEPVYVTKDEYLSGNIKKKIDELENVLPNYKFGTNEEVDSQEEIEKNKAQIAFSLKSLQEAMPERISAVDINVTLGTPWIPAHYIADFIEEELGVNKDNLYYSTYNYFWEDIKISHNDLTGTWSLGDPMRLKQNRYVTNEIKDLAIIDKKNGYNTTFKLTGLELLEKALNQEGAPAWKIKTGKKITKIGRNGEAKEVEEEIPDVEAIAAYQTKVTLLKTKFKNWIFKDPGRRKDLEDIYNNKFNVYRNRHFDGSHLVFSAGMSENITLRQHQKDAIARVLYGGNTLLAHEVGAGKTFEMIASAMESKRLGLCNKSVIVVPKPLIDQTAEEFKKLYPNANILVAHLEDFQKDKRRQFCSQIATGDYDAIVMGYTQFEKLKISDNKLKEYITEEKNKLQDALLEMNEREQKYTVKAIQSVIKKLEVRLKQLTETEGKDDVLDFEQLGIDRIFLDEAHNYKNLYYYTKMHNVAGLSNTEAQKAWDMYFKSKYINEITDEKGLIFATGTPVTNTMAEIYNFQRYLQPKALQELGIHNFDDWATLFGEVQQSVEVRPDGNGFKMRSRFNKFVNLPELMSLFHEVMDIKLAKDMKELAASLPKCEIINEVAEASPDQKEAMKDLERRANAIYEKDPSRNPRDNMLVITTDGRKIGLDMRLRDPLNDDFAGSKINLCVDNVYKIWERSKDTQGTQLIFCDWGIPKDKKSSSTSDDDDNGISFSEDALAGNFCIYDDIKQKLIARGIPENEIAFIHDAKNSDSKKDEIIKATREGKIRVLLGSTKKLGTGTNVQDKVVAMHDLDCPWTPAELEQRKGRMVRQGNENTNVELYRYVTNGTFDSYLWQVLEKKQQFISQIMTSDNPAREASDASASVLEFAEVKALCQGNPLIREVLELKNDIDKLSLAEKEFQRKKFEDERRIKFLLPEHNDYLEKNINAFTIAQNHLNENTHIDEKTNFSPFTVIDNNGNKQTYNVRVDAAKAFYDKVATTSQQPKEVKKIGEYKGFNLCLVLAYDSLHSRYNRVVFAQIPSASQQVNEVLRTQAEVLLGTDPSGNLTRLDNVLTKKFNSEEIAKMEKELSQSKAEIANYEAALNAEFPFAEELAQKRARQAELEAELKQEESNTKAHLLDNDEVLDEEYQQEEEVADEMHYDLASGAKTANDRYSLFFKRKPMTMKEVKARVASSGTIEEVKEGVFELNFVNGNKWIIDTTVAKIPVDNEVLKRDYFQDKLDFGEYIAGRTQMFGRDRIIEVIIGHSGKKHTLSH